MRVLDHLRIAHGLTALMNHTAFIERVNLTFRQGIAGLARDTWSLMSEPRLLLHAEWFRLYYHLARPHESLREPLPGFKRKYRARTPAMALGVTDRGSRSATSCGCRGFPPRPSSCFPEGLNQRYRGIADGPNGSVSPR